MNRQTFLRLMGAAAGAWVLPSRSTAEPANLASLPADEFWPAVRRAYRFQPGLTYLNTGGLGPAPLPVQAKAEQVARELQEAVETGRSRFDAAREVLCRFLGVQTDELAFVRNATEANGIVAAGLSLAHGDEVVFDSHAHPGGSFPWLQQQKLRGITVNVFEPEADRASAIVGRVESVLTPRTRVLQVSHVTAPTGIVLPVHALAKLCRERGIWFHIDGAQSAGMFPFNLAEIACDSYATSGHKWLGAPHETGILYVRRDRLAQLTSPMVGAHSAELASLPGELELGPTAARFEYGTRNAAAVAALASAAEWQDVVGRAAIAQRGRQLVAQLRAGLQQLKDVEILTPEAPDLSASMLTFRSPRVGYEALFGRLFGEHRLRCRPVSEQGLDAVRVSCHLFNTPDEIERLVSAVDQILRSA